MKLKHNSIRSGSRIKSSALIVRWQALPALQQTQCYQGTEGRFVCTGPASSRVRPACPGPGEHRGARPGLGVWGGVSASAPQRVPPPCPPAGAAGSGPSQCHRTANAVGGQGLGRCLSAGALMSLSPMGAPRVPAHPRGDPADMGAEPPALQFARSCSCQSWVPTALSTRSSPTEPHPTSHIPHPTSHIHHPASRIPHPSLISARSRPEPWPCPGGWGCWAGCYGASTALRVFLYIPLLFLTLPTQIPNPE